MENIKRMESSGSGEMPWAMGGGEEVVKAWQKAAEQAQKTMQEWSQATGASGSGGSGSSGKGKSS
jgi:ABC-type thiamine transport system substrate-binding protein